MSPTDFDHLTPFPRLILERSLDLVLAQELEKAANSAPFGQVIDRCGRDFLRQMLESSIQNPFEHGETRACPMSKVGCK